MRFQRTHSMPSRRQLHVARARLQDVGGDAEFLRQDLLGADNVFQQDAAAEQLRSLGFLGLRSTP
jgi:hypothetical protein